MTDEIKRMPIKEFRERGYLHEVNRLLLHPLGLALEAKRAKEPGVIVSFKADDFERARRGLLDARSALPPGAKATHESLTKLLGSFDQNAEHYEVGDMFFGGVWDQQDDREGIVFGEDLLSAEKAERVCTELIERREERKRHTGGWVIQPLPDHRVLSTTYTDPELRATGREVVEPGLFAGVEMPGDPTRPAR